MLKTLLATLLAAGIAAGAATTPAHAQFSDEQRALAWLLGLAALGAIANEASRRDDDDRAPVVTRRPTPQVISPATPRVIQRARPSTRRISVPESCRRAVETRRGLRDAVGEPCLRRSGVNVARLPDRCERLLDIGRTNIRAWGARCLQREGVRFR